MKRRVVLDKPCQAGQHPTKIARVRKSFNNAERLITLRRLRFSQRMHNVS